jgi:hypothetical protein
VEIARERSHQPSPEDEVQHKFLQRTQQTVRNNFIVQRHRFLFQGRGLGSTRVSIEQQIFLRSPLRRGWCAFLVSSPVCRNARRNPFLPHGSTDRVTWHLPRHSHATMLGIVGTPIGTMQSLLGHSAPEITREIYLHAIPDEQRRAVESVERLVLGPKSWHQPCSETKNGAQPSEGYVVVIAHISSGAPILSKP